MMFAQVNLPSTTDSNLILVWIIMTMVIAIPAAIGAVVAAYNAVLSKRAALEGAMDARQVNGAVNMHEAVPGQPPALRLYDAVLGVREQIDRMGDQFDNHLGSHESSRVEMADLLRRVKILERRNRSR